MNWTRFYHRIPDRVRLGVGGIALAILTASSRWLIVEWIRFWS